MDQEIKQWSVREEAKISHLEMSLIKLSEINQQSILEPLLDEWNQVYRDTKGLFSLQ